MIRIIKNGVKPKKYKYIYSHTCTNCTCEFEFEEEDCTYVKHEKHIDGEHTGKIRCPFCSELLSIDFKTTKSRKEEIIEEQNNSGSRHTITSNIDDFYRWSPSLCKCPNCGSSNTLVNDSIILTSIPPQYGFKCKDCGHKWTGPKPASTNTKLYDPWNNEHCNNCSNKSKVGDACYCCPHWPYETTCNTEVKKQ